MVEVAKAFVGMLEVPTTGLAGLIPKRWAFSSRVSVLVGRGGGMPYLASYSARVIRTGSGFVYWPKLDFGFVEA